MKLSPNSVKIHEGKITLKKRNRSSAWQAHYIIGSVQIRKSTKETDFVTAKQVAIDMYSYDFYRHKDGKPPISRKFSAVAKLAIAGMKEELEAGHGKRIYDTYINAINKYLIPYYGSHNVDNITYDLIKGFDKERREIQKRESQALGRKITSTDIKASTQNTYNAAMNRIFDVALERGYMTRLQVPQLTNKGVKGEKRPDFTLQEYTQLVSFMGQWISESKSLDIGKHKDKAPMMRALLRDYVIVLANTGMRPGEESMRLKWSDLHWMDQNGKRHLFASIGSKKGRGVALKNRNSIFKSAAVDALKRLHKATSDISHLDFEDMTAKKSDAFIFRLSDGTRTTNLNQTFEQLLEASGLLVDPRTKMNRTLYSLRHTYATLSLAAGVSFAFLEVQMGTSVAMLTTHYNHVTTIQGADVLSLPLGEDATQTNAAKGDALQAVKTQFDILNPVQLAIATTDFNQQVLEVDKNGNLKVKTIKTKNIS